MSAHLSANQPQIAHLDWRRIGAMSASFNLHGVAIALALLAMLAPISVPEIRVLENPTLIAEIVEPPPVQPPAILQARIETPTRSDPVPAPHPRVATDVAVDPSPTSVISTPMSQPAIPETVFAPTIVQADQPPATHGAVAYESVTTPGYPPIARRNGLEGQTILRVLVGTNGQVLTVDISRSSGHRELDRAAVIAVRGWRFRAAMESGVAIESWVEVPILFRLQRG